MPKNKSYFTPIEQTFLNYDKTRADYPLLASDIVDRITGVIKTFDTKQVYEDLDPAFAQYKHIVNDDVPPDRNNLFPHDSMLARMGAFMLYCSLIENRLRAMYRQRMAVINGTQTLTAAEEAEIYENLTNNSLNKHKLKRDVTEAQRIATFLLWSHDVDLHTFHLLEQFTKVRNALVHDAMFRSAYFDNEILKFLRRIYTHMQNMRAKMNNRLPHERALYADDTMRAARIVERLQGLTLGASISRDDVYLRLAGSTRLDTPMVNRRFCYIIAPATERSTTWSIHLKQPVKLLDRWDDTPAPWLTPTPLFRETANKALVEFCGYGVVAEIVADLKVFRGLKITQLID